MKYTTAVIFAGANGLIATALAAIGAHALPSGLPASDKAIFSLATQFHLFHALAILGTSVLLKNNTKTTMLTNPILWFQLGIAAFSGSLYLRVLLGPGSLGAFHWITPLGGVALMVGWIYVITLGVKRSKEST